MVHKPPATPNEVLKTRGLKTAGRQHFDTISIGTWNVRSSFPTGKLENVIVEAKRLRRNVLSLCEAIWYGRDRLSKDEYELICAGGDKHEYGVGILYREN